MLAASAVSSWTIIQAGDRVAGSLGMLLALPFGFLPGYLYGRFAGRWVGRRRALRPFAALLGKPWPPLDITVGDLYRAAAALPPSDGAGRGE